MKSPNLKQAVKLALFAGIAASMSTPVLAQDEEEDAAQLDRVVVTGSRISRVQLEGATPVVTIDREEIEATGFASIADVLRNTSFNSFGSIREASGNTAQSQALLSLRGIGSNRTLILLNGRRLPGSPVLDNQVQNLNAIPFAAVERIEILSDGASAVYGSDAIGGVVNIILRDDFEGVEASIRYAESTRPSPWERMVSLVGGITGAKGNVTFTMEKDFKSVIFARDRFYTSSADFNPPGQFDFANTTGYSIGARNVFNGSFFAGMVQGNPGEGGCGVYGDGFVDEHFSYYYGYYSICAWDFTKIAAQTASLDRMSMFLNADYEINDDLTFWARAGHNRVESFGRYAPAVGGFTWNGPALPQTTITYQGQTLTLVPINPGDLIFYRFNNTGDGRDTTQYNYVDNLQAGLKGFYNGMQWEFGVEYNQYDMHEWGDGYVNVMGLNQAGNNGWDPRHPDQSQFTDAVPSMRENANRRALSTYQKVDFGVQFDGPELGAGPVAFFVGGEYREETYKDQTQAQAEAGNIIGSAGGSAEGLRDSSGIFAEVSLPLMDTFELNAALRGDNYSDFGSNTSGKLSFRFQPMDAFVLRGSFGTGFRAPSLSTLFGAPAQSFEFSVDIPSCVNVGGNTLAECVARAPQQFETFFLSNPNLDAEKSNQYLIGGLFDFAEIGGPALTLSLDYYYIEIEDVITGIGAQDAFFLEFLGLLGPGTPFDGLVSVDRTGPQPIITARPINFESFDTTGIDFRVGYAVGLGDFGNLDFDLNLSKVLEFNQRFFLVSPLQDFTGFAGLPDLRWDLNTTWTYGDFAVNLQTYYIAGQDGENTILAPGTIGAMPSGPPLDSFMAHNLSVRWTAPWDADISVGAINLTDEDPVLDSSLVFDDSLYPLDGRMTFVSYTQRF